MRLGNRWLLSAFDNIEVFFPYCIYVECVGVVWFQWLQAAPEHQGGIITKYFRKELTAQPMKPISMSSLTNSLILPAQTAYLTTN